MQSKILLLIDGLSVRPEAITYALELAARTDTAATLGWASKAICTSSDQSSAGSVPGWKNAA